MKKLINLFLVITLLFPFSCESLVDDLNQNPNKINPEDLTPEQFLTGVLLANTVVQAGHLNRIAGMWSGQLTGFQSVYGTVYGYDISTAETESTWSGTYSGVVTNARYIVETAPEDRLLTGICKVVEAYAIGTAASLFGDIPYSQINDITISDPVFDSQSEVFQAVIALLDDAISDLGAAPARGIPADIYFSGDKDAWMETARTLQARYYLQLKDYPSALNAAMNGISTYENSMLFRPLLSTPLGTDLDDSNLMWQILEGGRGGDIGTGDSYLIQLIDPLNGSSRNNAKTDETARSGYYYINEELGSLNDGIMQQYEPHELVTYQENLLIMAECEARANQFGTALGHLNSVRQWLNGGGRINDAFNTLPYNYEDYVAADFASGGIENPTGIDDTRALLREIIEERFVTGFGSFMPFNDMRRLRKDDGDIAVPIPFNTGTATQHPERMPYSDDELNANSNAPDEDPGIYATTEVNQ